MTSRRHFLQALLGAPAVATFVAPETPTLPLPSKTYHMAIDPGKEGSDVHVEAKIENGIVVEWHRHSVRYPNIHLSK